MEKRVETHTPLKEEMESGSKTTKPNWLLMNIHPEVRAMLSRELDERKLLACIDLYLRYAKEESTEGKKVAKLTKTLSSSLYLFRDLSENFKTTPEYLNRIAKMLQLYIDAELRFSKQDITYYVEAVNKIALQIDFHLKGQESSYIVNVFLTCQRAQKKVHRLIMDALYKKYLTVPNWTASKVELPDKLMLMYIVAYKQWFSLFIDDKPKVLDIIEKFAMFKPRESFLTNSKIPEGLKKVYSQNKSVKELLTTSDNVESLKKSLEKFDEQEEDTEEFPSGILRTMRMLSIAEDSLLGSENQLNFSLLGGESEKNVPIPLSSRRMLSIVKKEKSLTLGMIDLTLDDVRPRMEWLQQLARKARDAQEVRVAGYPSVGGHGEVICLSDSEDSEVEDRTVTVHAVEDNSSEQVRSEEVLLTENSLASSVMAKNREKLDSITSNFDVGLNMRQVEKSSGLSSVLGTKSAIKFGVRDDLVGSTPRKVAENLGENQTLCATEENSLGGGVEDSQNSVDNYPIFNEIRIEERDMEAQPTQANIFHDHPNYFCDEFLQSRRRQSSEGQQSENVIFTMPPLTKRPLLNDDPVATTSSSLVPCDTRVHFTIPKPTHLPMTESLSNIVRGIMADFSDAEDGMEDEGEIESPSMETIEKADLVEFMEQISESERHTSKTPECIKPILDKSTSSEKSAKVKKKVKFGAAHVLEMKDLPREKIYRNYLERSSPRKAILKSSLKRSIHNSLNEDYEKIKFTERSHSNIMVKRTYVFPTSPASKVQLQVSPESKVSPSPYEPDVSLRQPSTSPQRTTSKQNQSLIRREFENSKKLKRRNSIACITYSEKKLSKFEKKLSSPANVEATPLPQDSKLYSSYVPLAKVLWPVIRDKSPGETTNVPDKTSVGEDEKKTPPVEVVEDKPLLCVPPGPFTRSRRKSSHGKERVDASPKRKKTPRKSTEEISSTSRVKDTETPNKTVPVLVVLSHIPKNVVVDQEEGRVPSSLSAEKEVKRKRKSNVEVSKITSNEQILDVSQEAKIDAPKAQSTPLREKKVSVSAKKVKSYDSVSRGSSKRIKFRKSVDQLVIPGAKETKNVSGSSSGTAVPQVSSDANNLSSSVERVREMSSKLPKRQNLTVITKKTMKIIQKDSKLGSRTCVKLQRMSNENIHKIIDYVAKYPSSNIEFLIKSGKFFHTHSRKNSATVREKKDTHVDEATKSTSGHDGRSLNGVVKNTEATTRHSDDCDMKRDSEQVGDDNPDVTKRGRRSEGKRNKTPRRLKRSQIYQKILEDSGVMEQIEVKPLSMLSMNEEIGKMASPDSTSSHGEANKQVENKFQRKPPSPEYVNSSISSTVNTEISSTTQIAGPSGSNSENSTEKKDDQMEPTIDEAESPTEVTAKGRKEQPKISKVEFNGPILRSTGSVSTPSAIPSPKQSQEPSTETVEESQEEFVSCDSHGDLSEAEKCDSQEINNTENPEILDKVSDEASGEVVENEEKDSVEQSESKGDEQPEEKDETLGCDSQGEQLAQMDTEVENEEFPQEIITEECQDASQEAQQGSPQEEQESAAEEEIEESVKKDEEVVRDTDDDDDDTSIDFEDFDTVSEYSDMESNENEADCKAKDNEPSGEKIQSRDPVDMDKSIDAAMINFDPSEAFKDTSDVESQHGDVQEMQVKDNLFENISSIESTEHNYLDNCALLASNQNGEQQSAKNPSPDSSNAVNHASHCTTPSDPMEMNCDTIPDTSNVASNGLNMDEQRTYVEHDGLFSSPIYDPEPDERSKFNGQMTDQLMYTHNHSNNMLLEPDSSENNIPRNLAIDDLVEEMPSDDTTLMTESDIFEEYCENLTSIGDNVTVETESEIVTEPFVSETGGTDDFVFRTTLPHEMQTTLPTSTYISATSLTVPEVLATRKSDRQRIKSHTNLYVEHDYSPRTDTNRITPITSTSRTGDRYLLPPKTEKMNRKRSFPGDGRDRKKQRKTYTMPESTLSPLPQLPTIANPNPQIPLPVMPQRPPVEQQLRAKAPVSSVSPYLEVHNSLQQQMGRQRCVIPLLPSPAINGDTATMRKFRRPNRMEHTPPHTLPVYEQISPCPEKIRTTGPEMKTFSMIPSNQSIAALASVAQKYPPKSATEIAAAKKDAFSQGIGEYQILQYTSPNPTDFCIIAPAREPPPVPLPAVQANYPNSAVSGNQSIHTAAGKVFLTAQPEDVPQFVVGESDDLVSTCLSSSK